MRRAIVLLAIGFVVTLAAVVGTRMSAEALAVVIGVICGVAAGVPVSLVILAATTRREQQASESGYPRPGSPRYDSVPPVVVIQGGAPSNGVMLPPYYPAGQPVYDAAPRQFHVVGEYEE